MPDDALGGDYTAVLHGYVDGERILPETYYFEVIARSRVFLPVLRRRE